MESKKGFWFKLGEVFNKILPFLAMFLFCYITFKNGVLTDRVCWEDESHVWTIAKHTNLFQLIDLMKVEGHFLLWYLCIMPFAKLDLWYPYPMLFINWLFAVLALAIMWYKAPFNNLIKLCITFSAPFVSLYSQWARCYSIGFLFLFLAMAIYKERLKHPYWYLLWLVLAANTSLPLCVSSAVLGCLFVYDLIKNKSDKKFLYVIFTTLILNLILFYFQFHGTTVPDYDAIDEKNFFILAFLGFEKLYPSVLLYKIYLLRVGIFIFLAFLFRSKRAFIFFTVTGLTVFLFFTFVYNARIHHLCTIYIFSIAAFWIYYLECPKPVKRDWFSIFYVAVLLELVFMPVEPPNGFQGYADFIFDYKKDFQNAKLYTSVTPIALAPSIPYLEKANIYLYDLSGINLASFEGLKIYFNAQAKKIDPDVLAKDIDMKKTNYLILNFELPETYMNGHKYQIKVEPFKSVYFKKRDFHLFVYRIVEVNTEPKGDLFKMPVATHKFNIYKDTEHIIENMLNYSNNLIMPVLRESN